jgi:hypothetical protein
VKASPATKERAIKVSAESQTIVPPKIATAAEQQLRGRSQMTRGQVKASKLVEQGTQKDPHPADFVQCLQAVVSEQDILRELTQTLAHFESNAPLTMEDLMRSSSEWRMAPRWVGVLEKQFDVDVATKARRGTKALQERARQRSKELKAKARMAREKAKRSKKDKAKRAAGGAAGVASELIKPSEPNPAVRPFFFLVHHLISLALQECCGSGCKDCVWMTYWDEV